MRYHLGCGSKYLEGYVNVDFPPEQHIVNQDVKVDLYSDLLQMEYEPCDEIRSHHVFEHFSYVDAMFLLRQWTVSLNPGGMLCIDVPDVRALAQALAQSNTVEVDFRVIRYLYGSHEASWAYHISGWTPRMLSHVLKIIGYDGIDTARYGSSTEPYPNCGFCVKGTAQTKLKGSDVDRGMRNIFELYLNGDTDFERSLCEYLLNEYTKRVRS